MSVCVRSSDGCLCKLTNCLLLGDFKSQKPSGWISAAAYAPLSRRRWAATLRTPWWRGPRWRGPAQTRRGQLQGPRQRSDCRRGDTAADRCPGHLQDTGQDKVWRWLLFDRAEWEAGGLLTTQQSNNCHKNPVTDPPECTILVHDNFPTSIGCIP